MKHIFLGMLFVVCVGCSDDMVDKNPKQMSDPYPVLCQTDTDCGDGYCEDARCLRSNPTMGLECNVFGIPLPDHGCQMTDMPTYGTAHPSDCETDADCKGSLFGQYCIVNLCSAQQSCEEKACDDPRFPNCHEHWEVCVK